MKREAQLFGNPRYWWTYSDEDFQRVVKEIALSCHAAHVPHVATYKWLVGLFE